MGKHSKVRVSRGGKVAIAFGVTAAASVPLFYLTAGSIADAASRPAADTTPDPEVIATATDQTTIQVYQAGLAVKETSNRSQVLVGQRVTFTDTVTATGLPFSEIQVEEDNCSPVTYQSGDNGDNVLQPGESWVYTCSRTLTQTLTNTVKVQGKPVFTNGNNGTPIPTYTPTPTVTATATSTPTPSATAVVYKDGTYTGPAVTVRIPDAPSDVYTETVTVTISGGKITAASMANTATDGTSKLIIRGAVPELVSQTLAAQSANIAGSSGATYTSQGFAQSLQGALTLAAQ